MRFQPSEIAAQSERFRGDFVFARELWPTYEQRRAHGAREWVHYLANDEMEIMLNDQDFAAVVKSTPLVSIDLLVRNPSGSVLIGLRRNEPARDCWFVPGGRVKKDERLDTAFSRIVATELGVVAHRDKATFLGVYEHIYETNAQYDSSYGTHYIVLGYEFYVGANTSIHGDDQHSELKWCSIAELLADPKVHMNTKAYFL